MLLIVVFAVANALPTVAHEFWIEPRKWMVEPGDVLEAHIRVGENMKGAPLSFLPQNTRRFEIATPKGLFPIKPKIGARPVVRGKVPDEGLNTIIYVTGSDLLSYEEPGKFEKFVKSKDLNGTIERHTERGLPETGFSERFSRYAKSLVSVGEGAGNDRFYGLFTEIVALKNPYVDDVSAGLPVFVTFKSNPRPDAQVEVYERNSDGIVTVTKTLTNDEGVAVISVKPGHDYMLDSVVMRELESKKVGDPVWESLWANLTFSVPGQD